MIGGSKKEYGTCENGPDRMVCTRGSVDGWEQCTVVGLPDGKVALRGTNNLYVSSMNGAAAMLCDRPSVGGWEAFEWVSLGGNAVALKGFNGQYVSSENGASGMMCNRPSVGGWETFTWGSVSGSRMAEESDGLEAAEESFLIYPNPAVDLFKIDLRNLDFHQGVMKVTDLSGKVILTEELVKEVTEIGLSLGMKAAVYVITVESGDQKISRRMLIER